MQQEEFHKILDELTDWFLGSSAQLVMEPKKDRKAADGKYEKTAPEGGLYPVVRSFKVKETACDWCGRDTHQIKFYSRDLGSNIWQAKCHHQGCRKKLKVHTNQIGQESSLIACSKEEESK